MNALSTRLLLAAAALVGLAGSANAAVLYNGDTTVGSDGSFFGAIPSIMQVVTTGAANVPQTINSFTAFGVRNHTATASGAQVVFVDFYSNVDESPTATNALTGATFIKEVGYNLPSIGANSSVSFTLPGVNATLPGNKVGVVIQFTNSAATAFSTSLSARYSTGTPSVGSNDGFIYEDANLDQAYSGAERTRVNGTLAGAPVPTNLRFAFDVTVPEPVSLSALSMGGLILGRRRRV